MNQRLSGLIRSQTVRQNDRHVTVEVEEEQERSEEEDDEGENC